MAVELPAEQQIEQSRGGFGASYAHLRFVEPEQAAALALDPGEEITAAGYIRRITVGEGARSRTVTAEQLCEEIDTATRPRVRYLRALVVPSVTYRNPFRTVRLRHGRDLVIERVTELAETPLEPIAARRLVGLAGPDDGARSTTWDTLAGLEGPAVGLRRYY